MATAPPTTTATAPPADRGWRRSSGRPLAYPSWSPASGGCWSTATSPTRRRAAAWLVGAAVAHDAVWLPLVLLVAAGVTRLLPKVARGPVAAALGLTAVMAVVAWPFAAGFGEDPHDPSVLVRDEAAGAAAYVAAVWAVAGVVVARRARAGRRPAG